MAFQSFQPVKPKRPLPLLEGLEQIQVKFNRLWDAVVSNDAKPITLWNEVWDAVQEVRTSNSSRSWLLQILNLVQLTLNHARPVLKRDPLNAGQLRALAFAFTALTKKVNEVRNGKLN